MVDHEIQATQKTIALFSPSGQADRNILACRGFLCAAGISFDPSELIAPPSDPPDVTFRSAQFEVVESQEVGRRRHDEYKAKLVRLQAMRCDCELWSEGRLRARLVEAETPLEAALSSLAKKVAHYGLPTCGGLDALVYFNHGPTTLGPEHVGDYLALSTSSPWRSVSLLVAPYAIVLAANPSAPEFLIERIGQVRCSDDWNLFEA